MTITHLQESKELRAEGDRLGRVGMSQRAHVLVSEYMAKNPNGHYMDVIRLTGALHAIYLATKSNAYWREKANEGYQKERYEIEKFNPVSEDEFFKT